MENKQIELDEKERLKKINAMMASWNEKAEKKGAKEPIVFRASERPDLTQVDYLSTSLPEVDAAFGGGIPKGLVTTFWGPQSCGKTFLAMRIAAELTKQRRFVLYVDLEGIGKCLPMFQRKLGLDPDYVIVLRAQDHGDQLIDRIEDATWDSKTNNPKNVIDLIIVDSISNLAPKANMDKVDKDGAEGGTKVGAHAKLMTDWLNRYYGRGVSNGTQALILISQARANISTTGGHGPAFIPTGGNAVLHDTKLMVRFSRKVVTKLVGSQMLPIGQDVILTIEKNSATGLIGNKVQYSALYAEDQDLDDTRSLIDKMTEWGHIQNSVPKRGYSTIILPELGDAVVKNKELETAIRQRAEVYATLKDLWKLGKPKTPPTLIGREYVVDVSEGSSEEVTED